MNETEKIQAKIYIKQRELFLLGEQLLRSDHTTKFHLALNERYNILFLEILALHHLIFS